MGYWYYVGYGCEVVFMCGWVVVEFCCEECFCWCFGCDCEVLVVGLGFMVESCCEGFVEGWGVDGFCEYFLGCWIGFFVDCGDVDVVCWDVVGVVDCVVDWIYYLCDVVGFGFGIGFFV